MTGILDLPNADILIYLAETYAIEETFELYNTVGWTENKNGDGVLSVPSAAAVKRQNYGMRSEISDTSGRNSAAIYKTFTNTSNDPVYVNFWFRINSTDLDEDDMTIIMFCTSGLSVLGKLEIVETDGVKYLRVADYGVDTYGTSANPITVGTWHHVRVGLKCHNTEGVVYLELDETEIVNETGIETSYNGDTIGSIFVGVDNLYTTGDFAMQTDFDEVYVALAQISVNVELDDEAILNVHLHLGCTNEVSSFEVMIDRGNPTYDQLIDPGEANALSTGLECDIYLGRGNNKPLLLVGQIDEIEYCDEIADYSFRNVCIVRGRCNGYQLFGKHYDGNLISDIGTAALNYKRVAGEASSMVAYLIDNYTSLKHVRVYDLMGANAASAQKDVTVADGSVFTAEQLVKVEDDNGWEYNQIDSIASNTLTMYNNLTRAYATADNGKVWIDLIEECDTTFTKLEYIDTLVFEIIKYIAEVTDLADVIGYDFRVDYDGKFAFFSKGTKSESYSLQDECYLNRYLKDANRIKNKIKVFGKADKPYPVDVDGQPWSDALTESWSENIAQLGSDAAPGQKVVNVAAGKGGQFAVGDTCFIIDNDASGEECTVASISTDALTMESNLGDTYTTAKHAVIFVADTSSSEGWGYIPVGAWDDFTITNDAVVYTVGSKSLKVVFNNSRGTLQLLYVFEDGAELNMNDYNSIKMYFYFTTTLPYKIKIRLYSGACSSITERAISPVYELPANADAWHPIEVNGGKHNEKAWVLGSSFSWTDIKMMDIIVGYSANGIYTLYVDGLHWMGKRWGGGTDDATVDGYAENTSSQSTYTVKELIIINDLLLCDAECENKAQALIDFYAVERLVIEVDSDTIDWSTYHPMAGNKVAVDLDELGVTGSSYRIDSIDIVFRGEDNSLMAGFILDNTPIKLADYLYKLSEKIRLLERKYDTIR